MLRTIVLDCGDIRIACDVQNHWFAGVSNYIVKPFANAVLAEKLEQMHKKIV